MIRRLIRQALEVRQRREMIRRWRMPFDPPTRTELPIFDEAFEGLDVAGLLDGLAAFQEELKRIPKRLFLNAWIGPADVAFYYATIREARPERIVEVGSGYSTEVAIRAVERNGSGTITCIDPEPRKPLDLARVRHVRCKVQDADPALIKGLRRNDILFIDSSHTATEALFHFSLLEQLPAGVHVHYHDIDYPWERPDPTWDEDEVIHKFIASKKWQVRVFGSALTRNHLAKLRAAIPFYKLTPYRHYNALWLITG
jgi:hypothetical protein